MSKPYYRILWEENYGPIPVDKTGRSYDIHHINGNHHDNRIENLQCLTIDEHYKIHLSQGDIMACCAILKRLRWPAKFSEEQKLTLSEEARKAANIRVANGTHNFLGGELQKKHQQRRKLEGTHNFVNSNPNYINGEVVVNCVDKSGNRVRIIKSIYSSQSGPKDSWEFVSHASKEGKKRLLDSNVKKYNN